MSTANIIGNAIFGLRNKSGGNYINPAVKESLVGLWKFDQNTNESPTRNIIKNTIKDKGGDLELLNFAYKANSGYNGYPEDFTSWNYNSGLIVSPTKFQNNGDAGRQLIYYHTSIRKEDVLEFKVKITLDEQSKIRYWYIKEDGTGTSIRYSKSGTYTIPTSYFSKYTGENTWFGFEQLSGGCIIEQLPLHEGALVTDGKDDMIVSQKTVQEMGITDEITVVSMIHQIGLSSLTTINNIRSESVAHVVCRNICSFAGKTGIYGYSKQINTNNLPALINNILGDKKDYTAEGKSALDPTDKFFVQGYKYRGSISEVSPIAVYWTFISNKVLTTDEINQIIAYFKLDKYVTPQVIYDVKRQGLTNDTPAADWYLKDFSGNGHDMQLYNYAKTPESGINEDGGLQSDGIDDYGKAEGLPIFKDYTVVADRTVIGTLEQLDGGVSAKCTNYLNGSFVMDYKDSAFSFGGQKYLIHTLSRIISYQSKYISNGKEIVAGNSSDVSDLYVGKLGIDDRYSAIALYSYLLFPYSLSEFLLERQLKRYKLGTLYPGMIEWRPKVNINVPVVTPPTFSMNNGSDIITNGQYIPEGTEITIQIFTPTDSSVGGINEATAKINGVDIELSPSGNNTYYGGKFIVSSKQKIDITIDEYIRYENIVQPYPAIINLKQDGKTITWGDKLKVGSDIVFVGSANLLPELYTVSETRYNGVTLYPNTIIKVEKSMVFDNARTYLKANEPSCILSPNRLRIPNSSYKILGYIPDLTGKGNHGVINNSAYAGMSGANGYKYDWNTYTSHIAGVKPTDNAFKVNLTAETSTTALFGTPIFTVGSKSHYFRFKISGLINNQKIQIDYPKGSDDTVITSDRFGNGEYSTKDYTVGEVKRLNFYVINAVKGEPISVSIEQLPEYESSFCLDGVDDFVTIPTLAHGAKQVLMKVNLQSYDRYLYDQRNIWSQYLAIVSAGKTIAYEYSNKGGKTYIDGILNEHIIDKDLLNITHNITATNANIGVQYAPNIGTSFARGNFAQMALFDFMLFPEISSEEEIKELNDIVGIENNIEVS